LATTTWKPSSNGQSSWGLMVSGPKAVVNLGESVRVGSPTSPATHRRFTGSFRLAAGGDSSTDERAFSRRKLAFDAKHLVITTCDGKHSQTNSRKWRKFAKQRSPSRRSSWRTSECRRIADPEFAERRRASRARAMLRSTKSRTREFQKTFRELGTLPGVFVSKEDKPVGPFEFFESLSPIAEFSVGVIFFSEPDVTPFRSR
jgi:hypothetical protein